MPRLGPCSAQENRLEGKGKAIIRDKPPHPLAEKGPHLILHIDNRETTTKRGLDHDGAKDKLTLAKPEERKSQRRELLCHPGGHVDQRGHIPHPREGYSIDDQGFTTKGQKTRTTRFVNMVHSFDTGTPVITIQIPNTNENTQNLNFRR